MRKKTLFVGVDVGQEELWAVVDGQKTRSFAHTVKGINDLWNWVMKNNPDSDPHFCMEATGVYSKKLAVCLLKYPDTLCSIINPAQIAAFAKAQLRRTKTDRIDAQVILAFAKSQEPQPWIPQDASLEQLYALVVQADALCATQRQWANRQHTQNYIPNLPKVVQKTSAALQRSLKRQLANIEKAIEELYSADPLLKSQMELLCTIPGVAEHSAARFLAYGASSLTSHSAKALVAHAGLAPRQRQSGISVHGKSYIAKEGNKRLRHSLFMPTLVAINHNPIIKHHYQRLLANDKLKMVALVACMKKLLLISRAILKNKKPFDPKLIPLT